MPIYKHIVVALSLDEHEDKPLMDKARMLIEKGAEVSFINSVEQFISYECAFSAGSGVATDVVLKDKAIAHLKKYLQTANVGPHKQVVLEGAPSIAVVEYAKKQGADLIIVGSHGRHGIKLLLGSAANGVLHHAHCDVLAVRLEN